MSIKKANMNNESVREKLEKVETVPDFLFETLAAFVGIVVFIVMLHQV